MSFLQRYLLITVVVTVLLSLSSPMPLSWSNSIRHRRSRTEPSATEAPTLPMDAGTVYQNPLANSPTAGGETNTTNSSATKYMHDCMSECYNIPQERIDSLKRQLRDDREDDFIHPHFLLGEYLENLHREMYCSSINLEAENIVCEEDQAQLVNEDIVPLVRNYSAYLNDRSASCGPTYQVDYHPNRYPRYVVNVHCSNTNDRIRAGLMRYLQYDASDSTWNFHQDDDVAIGCQCDITKSDWYHFLWNYIHRITKIYYD